MNIFSSKCVIKTNTYLFTYCISQLDSKFKFVESHNLLMVLIIPYTKVLTIRMLEYNISQYRLGANKNHQSFSC